MSQGVVKWFDTKKGFGFITGEDESTDIFVHYSGIDGDGFRKLRDGDRVEYELVDSDKGPQAKNVKSLEPDRPEDEEAS